MRLLIEPDDGANPLIKAINSAKSSIEIMIFRFDQREIEKALVHAVGRGVSVHALIAHTNRAGEENLRRLEMRLLAGGVTVARTADDLMRYHGKLMIVDRREIYLLAFNLTYLDIERSRSYGIITRSRNLVREAVKLFEADSKRSPYEPGLATFVVSPANARKELARFVQGAKKQLLIYDPKISDPLMIRQLEERARAGVDVRIIGKLSKSSRLDARKLMQWRLHTRTMVRDGHWAFVGSQSLRGIELDMRREIGIIFRDSKIVRRLLKIFEDDWLQISQALEKGDSQAKAPAEKVAKKVAKAVVKEMPAVAPVVDTLFKEFAGEAAAMGLNAEEVEETVKDAVKEAVREAVQDVVEEAVHNGQNGGGTG